MFRVSKVRNTGVGDARSSDGGEVRGPEIGDWLALGEHLGWPKVSLFLLDRKKGCPKIGISDKSGTEQDGLRGMFLMFQF